MRSRIARAGVYVAEAGGLLVAAALAICAFVFWRVQAAPVDLGWAAPGVRAIANSALFNGSVRRIDGITLSKSADGGAYLLQLEDVRLGRRGAEASAQLPRIDLAIVPGDLFSGKAGPRRIMVDGAELRIVRREDRKLKLDFGEASGDRARVFQAVTGGAYLREAFERAELRNATITFVDEASGRRWVGRDGTAEVVRTPGGYAAQIVSNFVIRGASASLAFRSNYDVSTEVISSNLTLANAPVGDLVAVFFNADTELLTSPISGGATVDLASDGTLLSSQIDMRAGAGKLTLGGWSTDVAEISASATFDPKKNEFSVERVKWDGAIGAGALAGVVALQQAENGRSVERVDFDLSGENLILDRPENADTPLAINALSAKGAYSVAEKRLAVDSLVATFLGVDMKGAVSITSEPGKSPGVAVDLRVDGALAPATLLTAWPQSLATGARDFVATRMPRGVFSDIAFRMALKSGAVGRDGALPDDAMTLSFRADGAEVIYAPGMTPLTGVAGRGTLGGNSFSFKADKGKVDRVAVLSGEVDIPVLSPKGAPAHFRVRASGDAGDILAVLSQEPLAVLKETNFVAAQFSGPAIVAVEIERPNLRVAPRDSYRYKGAATFKNLSVENALRDATLEAGEGRLDLTTDQMTIAATANIGDAPIAIDWRQRFSGNGDKTIITASGVADSAMADLLGVRTRQLVQGTAPFKATATGDANALRKLAIEVDLGEARLVSEALGWLKPQGKAAMGSANFEFASDGVRMTGMSVKGDDLSISGAAHLAGDGTLMSFDLPVFTLAGAADLALRGRRTPEGGLSMEAEGAYLNASEMVRSLIDNGGAASSGKSPFSIKAKIDRVDLRGGSIYRDASLDFDRNAEAINVLHFDARDEDGKPLSIDLLQAGEEDQQVIEARSEDVGAMLAGIFGVASVKGGTGRLDFIFTPGALDEPRKGVLEAHDLRIVKAPLLAKIFAAGSLTGLADLVNGEGIELKNAVASFAIEDGVIRISESRATGPSVGITAVGSLPLDGGAIALNGAVAPAYQVNSFLGKAPVIGDLFVNRKGEGILALSYAVDGEANEPRVTVNPLSALTPGVLRRMFEGARAEGEAGGPVN